MTHRIVVKIAEVKDGKSNILDKFQYDLPHVTEPEPEPTPTIEKFEVTAYSLIVRAAPDLDAADTGKRLTRGAVIDTYEHTVEDNYVWRRHDLGWSAEKHVTNTSQVFMVPYSPKVPPPSQGGKAPLLGRYQAKRYNGSVIMPKAAGLSFNVREMMYFGTSVVPGTTEADIYGVLDAFKREGCEILRFYVSHHFYNDISWQTARLEWFLKILRSKGFKAVPVFMDSIAHSGFFIEANRPYHNASHLGHLNISWYHEKKWRGETSDRLRAISRVIAKFEDVVCTFDICNEPAIVLAGFDADNANAFKLAWTELSEIAYAETGKVIPLTVGLIDSLGAHDHSLDWYKGALWFWDIPTLHVMSVHMYYDKFNKENKMYNTDLVRSNADAAYALNMPLSIGEAGFHADVGDFRSNALEIFLNRDVVGNGANQVLYWGGDLRYNSVDKGFTDHFAIADFRPDFFDMVRVIQEWQNIYFKPLERL